MREGRLHKWMSHGFHALLCLGLLVSVFHFSTARAQEEESSRKVRSKVAPVYPDLARKMSITGTVRMQVIVEANGSMKEAKVVGGHPILVNAAMDAVKKWKFEPGPAETTEIVEFKFAPQ